MTGEKEISNVVHNVQRCAWYNGTLVQFGELLEKINLSISTRCCTFLVLNSISEFCSKFAKFKPSPSFPLCGTAGLQCQLWLTLKAMNLEYGL